MAIIQCKACSGDLHFIPGKSVAVCEYCGRWQTVPSLDDEKKLAMFERANQRRVACEFDVAAGIYESIMTDFPDEAEAYWGLVLCKYGIEYVDDLATGKKVPTCHRTIPQSILEDSDFLAAQAKADSISGKIYLDEAEQIDAIQKRILEVVAKETPYDIFICYKETDDDTHKRTEDSSDAQDLYTELTKEGYRVFFSRNTLKSKAGLEFEPYIYAALTSAKVMLVVGSKTKYFNAVWVKNEWARFLNMMRAQPEKRMIACYKNMDAKGIPEELRKLQALDMNDMMFYSTLKERVEQTLGKKSAIQATAQTGGYSGPGVESLLRRGKLYLENKEWAEANATFDKVLDIEVETVDAHIGKLCAEYKISDVARLAQCAIMNIADNRNYRNAMRFATPDLEEKLLDYGAEALINAEYLAACAVFEKAKTIKDYEACAKKFKEFDNRSNSRMMHTKCLEEIAKLQEHARAVAEEKRRQDEIREKFLAVTCCSPNYLHEKARSGRDEHWRKLASLKDDYMRHLTNWDAKSGLYLFSVIAMVLLSISGACCMYADGETGGMWASVSFGFMFMFAIVALLATLSHWGVDLGIGHFLGIPCATIFVLRVLVTVFGDRFMIIIPIMGIFGVISTVIQIYLRTKEKAYFRGVRQAREYAQRELIPVHKAIISQIQAEFTSVYSQKTVNEAIKNMVDAYPDMEFKKKYLIDNVYPMLGYKVEQ